MNQRKRPFPIGSASNEQAELANFKARLAAEQTPRALELKGFLASHGSTCGIDTLLRIARESWDSVVVYWSGLPPAEQRRFEDVCVPWWIEVREREERITTKAQQRRREANNG